MTSRRDSVPSKRQRQQSKARSPQPRAIITRPPDKNIIMTQNPSPARKDPGDDDLARSHSTLAASKSSSFGNQGQQSDYDTSKQVYMSSSKSTPALISHSEPWTPTVTQDTLPYTSVPTSSRSQPGLLPSPVASHIMPTPSPVLAAGHSAPLLGVPSPASSCLSTSTDHTAQQSPPGFSFREDRLWQQQPVVRNDSVTGLPGFPYGGLIGTHPSLAGSPLYSRNPSLTPPSPSSSQYALPVMPLQQWSQAWQFSPNFPMPSPLGLLPSPGVNQAMYPHWYASPPANPSAPSIGQTSSYPYTAQPTYQHVSQQMPQPPRK